MGLTDAGSRHVYKLAHVSLNGMVCDWDDGGLVFLVKKIILNRLEFRPIIGKYAYTP